MSLRTGWFGAASAFVITFLALAAPTGWAGEEPTDGTCDSTDVLVCAGASAAGEVDCVFASPTSIRCDWTRGYIWSGFSPALLPGDATATSTATLEVCVSGVCQVEALGVAPPTCAWLPASDCVEWDSDAGFAGPVELSPGGCLKVTVAVDISVTARVVGPDLALASVTFANAGSGAGEACVLDDGR